MTPELQKLREWVVSQRNEAHVNCLDEFKNAMNQVIVKIDAMALSSIQPATKYEQLASDSVAKEVLNELKELNKKSEPVGGNIISILKAEKERAANDMRVHGENKMERMYLMASERHLLIDELLQKISGQPVSGVDFLGMDTAWPLSIVLNHLVIGCEYLLKMKDYDGPDYEEIGHSITRAKEIIQLLAQPVSGGPDNRVFFADYIQRCVIEQGQMTFPSLKNAIAAWDETMKKSKEKFESCQPVSGGVEDREALAKRCFYAGFEKATNDDANCFTAWREEAPALLKPAPPLTNTTNH
jgi:hypothetical protein